MKLNELMMKAASGYPDSQLLVYWDAEAGSPRDNPNGGDTLARFVVLEIAETFDPEATDEMQLAQATSVLERAVEDLQGVIEQLAGDRLEHAMPVHMVAPEHLRCTLCGNSVAVEDLRDHLREHNPNAEGMDWEDIRNVFVAANGGGEEDTMEGSDDASPSKGFSVLVCPECETEGRIGQHDFVPGCAMIHGVYEDGTVEWTGQTEMDWDMQRPSSNPAEYVCLACDARFTRKQLGIGVGQ